MRLLNLLTKSFTFGISLSLIVLCLAIGGIETIMGLTILHFSTNNAVAQFYFSMIASFFVGSVLAYLSNFVSVTSYNNLKAAHQTILAD